MLINYNIKSSMELIMENKQSLKAKVIKFHWQQFIMLINYAPRWISSNIISLL